MGGEAGGDGDVEDGHVGLAQELAGAFEAQAHVVAAGRHREMAQEQALDLAHGQARPLRQLNRRQGLVEMVGHGFHDAAQLVGLGGQVALGAHALAVGGRADALVLELVGHQIGEVGTVIGADDLQHQVDRGRAARAGVALAVDLEHVAGALDLGEFFLKAGAVLPVDGAAEPVELAGFGQDVRADRKAAERRTLAAQRAQGGERLALAGEFEREACANEQDIHGAKVGHGIIDLERQAVRRRHRIAIDGHGGPGIAVVAEQAIGRAHRIDGGREAEHREFVDEQEGEVAGGRERFGHGAAGMRVRPVLAWGCGR